jgi:hypothetical protein
MSKIDGATLMARSLKQQAMSFNGPALVNVKLHHAAGRKPQEFGWLTP